MFVMDICVPKSLVSSIHDTYELLTYDWNRSIEKNAPQKWLFHVAPKYLHVYVWPSKIIELELWDRKYGISNHLLISNSPFLIFKTSIIQFTYNITI